MKKLISISILFCLTSCYNQEKPVDKSKLMGNDYRIFQSTPAWELAEAVKTGDVVKIKEEIVQKKVPVDYLESRFGNTLLMMAIYNSEYESVKTLLELGANPNLHDTYKGETAVIVAAGNDEPKYLKLVLEYKGDPNSIENVFSDPNGKMDQSRNSALNKAVLPSIMGKKNIEKVKLLVEAGADINYTKKGIIQSALADALIQDQMDVAMYLIEKGADYKKPITLFVGGGEEDVSVLQILRKSIIDLNSEQYKKKMEVIAFLKSKGLDYDKEPIDDADIERMKNMYPDNWQEYVKRY